MCHKDTMNRRNRAIITGMILGDGYIKTASAADKLAGRHPAAQISFGHSIKQQEYAQYKVDVLNKMFGGKATLRYGKPDAKYLTCYANKSNPYFKTLKGLLYIDGKKRFTKRALSMLSPEGIAFWFMDDGSYRMNKRSNGTISSVSLNISTYCSKEEVDNIINYFNDTYSIEFRPAFCKRTKLWYVRTNTKNARKLAGLIKKYLVPSMKYKISCVQDLNNHELSVPDVVCTSCGKTFGALKAKGLCMKCYNDKYFNELAKKTRTCSLCNKTESAKWFVGTACRACYQRKQRSGNDIVQANENEIVRSAG